MRTRKVEFFASIVNAVVVILLPLVSIDDCADAYPSELLEIDPETDSMYVPPWRIVDALDKEAENDVVRFEEGLEDLQKIFGIRGHMENKSDNRKKIPPQFMIELYNTIADSSGVTRGKNPYNAKVVRSFIERDTLFSHLYLFNISGLEINESVLEAELHLYRKRTSIKTTHPTMLTSPYYLVRVFQVLEGKSIAEPNLHKLLNVHYVGARASGWQVFNIRQAVLAWVSGAPNLGLLVTATNLFDDEVTVEFSRRNDYHSSKQPILVLFNDDGKGPSRKSQKIGSRYYTFDNGDNDDGVKSASGEIDDSDNVQTRRRRDRESSTNPADLSNHTWAELSKEYSYGTQLGNENLRMGETEFFRREKKFKDNAPKNEMSEKQMLNDDTGLAFDLSLSHEESSSGESDGSTRSADKSQDFSRQRRGAFSKRVLPGTKRVGSGKFVPERRMGTPQTISSMDIYERAMVREQTMKKNANGYTRKRKMDNPRVRERRSSTVTENDHEEKSKSYSSTRRNTTECARYELYVDFKEIGLSSAIIAPKGYSAYHCQGMCNSPLSQDQQPTNHATVQGLVHKMGILADVHMPCCVPTKLLRTSILFFDDNENVVLKVYEDMVADRCGCR